MCINSGWLLNSSSWDSTKTALYCCFFFAWWVNYLRSSTDKDIRRRLAKCANLFSLDNSQIKDVSGSARDHLYGLAHGMWHGVYIYLYHIGMGDVRLGVYECGMYGAQDERLDLNWLICQRAGGWTPNVSYLHLCLGGSDVICKFNLSSSNGIYPTGGRGRSALLRFYYQFLWFMHSLLFVPAQEPPDPRFPFPMHRPPVLCLSRIADCQLAATLWLRHAHKKVIKFLFTLVIGSEKH